MLTLGQAISIQKRSGFNIYEFAEVVGRSKTWLYSLNQKKDHGTYMLPDEVSVNIYSEFKVETEQYLTKEKRYKIQAMIRTPGNHIVVKAKTSKPTNVKVLPVVTSPKPAEKPKEQILDTCCSTVEVALKGLLNKNKPLEDMNIYLTKDVLREIVSVTAHCMNELQGDTPCVAEWFTSQTCA